MDEEIEPNMRALVKFNTKMNVTEVFQNGEGHCV